MPEPGQYKPLYADFRRWVNSRIAKGDKGGGKIVDFIKKFPKYDPQYIESFREILTDDYPGKFNWTTKSELFRDYLKGLVKKAKGKRIKIKAQTLIDNFKVKAGIKTFNKGHAGKIMNEFSKNFIFPISQENIVNELKTFQTFLKRNLKDTFVQDDLSSLIKKSGLSQKKFANRVAQLKEFYNKTGQERVGLLADKIVKKNIQKLPDTSITKNIRTFLRARGIDKETLRLLRTQENAVSEFFKKGTLFEHTFPRVLVPFIEGKKIQDALYLTGTRTSQFLNNFKMKSDLAQQRLVQSYLKPDGISLSKYTQDINKLRADVRKATGGYEIGYIKFDKNKNPTPITNAKTFTTSYRDFGPQTMGRISAFKNAQYTKNLLKNYLANPNDPVFGSLKANNPVRTITPNLISAYTELAKDYSRAQSVIGDQSKFIKFAEKNMNSPLVRAVFKSPLSSLKVGTGPGFLPRLRTVIMEAAKRNEGGVCNIFRAEGGRIGFAAGSSCVRQMEVAFDADPVKTTEQINKIRTVPEKIKTATRGFLGALGKFGPAVGKFGAIAAAGAIAQPLVKQFRNDDPATYLTDPEQIEGMLLSTIEAHEQREKLRSPILDWGIGAGTVGATAAAIPGTGAMYKYRRGLLEKKIPKAGPFTEKGVGPGSTTIGPRGKGYGKLRAGAGVGLKLISGMYTPAGLLATEPLRIARMRGEGEDWAEIAKSPTLWMGPAFADTMTKIATAGMKPTSKLARGLSLGISRPMLKTISRRFGMPGLALSLGLSGYDTYQDWKNKEGWFEKTKRKIAGD